MEIPKLSLTKKQRNILIGIVIAIIAVPGVYVIRFFSHAWSSDPADWGTFGDYIGGLLNPLISLLTLAVTVLIALYLKEADDKKTAKNLSASYQPQLVIDQGIFYTYLSDKFHHLKTTGFSKTQNPDLVTANHVTPFGLDIYNIGLGPAKNITLEYQINTEEILQAIDVMSVVRPANERVSIQRLLHQILQFTYPPILNAQVRVEVEHANTENLTHLLNVEVVNKAYQYFLPRYLMEFYTIYQYYWMEQMQQDANNLPIFPAFKVKMNYFDINNHPFEKSFEIILVSVQGGLSEFINNIVVRELN